MDDVDTLESINGFYSRVRWNNQFKQLTIVPKHLQTVFDGRKTVLEKYQDIAGRSNGIDESKSLVKSENDHQNMLSQVFGQDSASHSVLQRQEQLLSQRPAWHAPWKLIRVINGHVGWVRCLKVDPVDNEWFATGSNDTTVKIWDLASGKLKLTLAGHVMTVRDVAISQRHPYLFSASEDKMVKCWDLEKNQIIRDYHGHLSGVHTVDIHPTLDLIASAGRDGVVKLWDIRSRTAVMTLIGHKSPITKVHCLPVNPQVVSSSTDATVRLWDVTAGKSYKILTHHKRSVRDFSLHPSEFSMVSACTDDIRSWKLPEGALLTNFASESTGIINTLSVNQDDVLFAGGDDGMLSFYDYKSGHKYQTMATQEVPGSLESERAILTSAFDRTGLRLITGEADKSIKVWKQIPHSTPETHPGLPWAPSISAQRF